MSTPSADPSAPVPLADPADYPRLLTFVSEPRSESYPFIDPAKSDLSGRSVLITGASQGLGETLALAFARAGCDRIAILARSVEGINAVAERTREAAKAADRDATPNVVALPVDVTAEDQVRTAVEKVTASFGGTLDILVNNSGVLEENHLVAESDADNWWNAWQVNMQGTHVVTKHCLPALLASTLRTVVNMSSGMGLMLTRGYSAYSTSKMALCRYTELLVLEYAARGLVAFAFEPGLAETKMAGQLHPELAVLPRDHPSLVPDSVLWLVRERREWLSGRIVSARWDLEKVVERREEIVEKDLLKFKVAL